MKYAEIYEPIINIIFSFSFC